ncbi:hypothetical protein [Flavitalea sp.]|nr:hypothetical protein [Flavitalea sp.]
MVVLQFIISTVLITGTLIIYQQISFLQKSKLGFNKEQVMLIEGIGSYPSRQRYESFKNTLPQIPRVKRLQALMELLAALPGQIISVSGY